MSETPLTGDQEPKPENTGAHHLPQPPTPPAIPEPYVSAAEHDTQKQPVPSTAQFASASTPYAGQTQYQQYSAPTSYSMPAQGQPAMGGAAPAGYPGVPQAGYQPPFAGVAPSQSESLFANLFDLSFETYHTKSFIKLAYILAVTVVWLMWIGHLIQSIVLLSNEYAGGSAVVSFIVTLVVGALTAVVMTVFVRIVVEFFVANINKAEDVRRMRELKEAENK
ncbi:MAG: DUF4282 domain-containing protein [Actinomycetaceae bacterium]|nr:DUF4282 domain-containing protein [Actinomycetaceae bacterium]